MDIKAKLEELLRDVQYLGGLEGKIADHLIAHGVTVQECCHKTESVISRTGLMCTSCHSDIDRDAVFCKYCGANVVPQPPIDMSRMFENASIGDLRSYREKTQPQKGE